MAHWLMKSEPDVYSVDDLARETGPALWEGCRNYTVRNFFRDTMQDGDLVERFQRIVTLDEMRRTPELEGFPLLMRGQRLSVMPVSDEHWRVVLSLARG